MKELIEFIAKSLASNPDAVVVTETFEDGQVILRLEVAPEDKGKVIGRQGRVARDPGHAGNRLISTVPTSRSSIQKSPLNSNHLQ